MRAHIKTDDYHQRLWCVVAPKHVEYARKHCIAQRLATTSIGMDRKTSLPVTNALTAVS